MKLSEKLIGISEAVELHIPLHPGTWETVLAEVRRLERIEAAVHEVRKYATINPLTALYPILRDLDEQGPPCAI